MLLRLLLTAGVFASGVGVLVVSCGRAIGADSDDDTSDVDSETDGCPSGETLCEGVCRDLMNDRVNCRECGRHCFFADYCVEGVCAPDWTDCFEVVEQVQTCTQMCEMIPGASCSVDACHVSATAIVHLEGPECTDPQAELIVGCDAPLPVGANAECCCNWE